MLSDLQRVLIRALTSETPVETLRREAASLTPDDRAWIERVDGDGLVLSRLLIQKVRFELICRGGDDLSAWFDRDPRGFTEAFRIYDREIPRQEFFAQQEARRFRDFCTSRGILPNSGPPPTSKET